MPAANLQSSGALEANTSTSTHLQPASGAPELLKQIPPRLHACSPPPYLHASLLLHLRRASIAPELHTSTISSSTSLQCASRPPYTSIRQVRLGIWSLLRSSRRIFVCTSGQAICTIDRFKFNSIQFHLMRLHISIDISSLLIASETVTQQLLDFVHSCV